MSKERRKGKEFTPATKLAGYERSAGKCEKCGSPLAVGKFHYDHKRAVGLGGDNSLANMELLCLPCHNDKTHSSDNPTMRKADAQKKVHIGATRQKAKIPSRPKEEKPASGKLPLPPRRPMFE